MAALVLTITPAQLGSAVAQPARYGEAVIERWRGELAKVDRMILEGEYKSAKKRVNGLLDEMCDRIVKGTNADRILAMTALVRAVAEAGLGNLADARWDRDIAYAIFPDLEKLDLAAYGDVAVPLAAPGSELPSREAADDEELDPEQLTPPKKLRSVWPKYPRGRRVNCLENVIVVGATIDEKGQIRSPVIDDSVSSVLSFAALDVLREWRFEPARYRGEPIAASYRLTINFKLQGC